MMATKLSRSSVWIFTGAALLMICTWKFTSISSNNESYVGAKNVFSTILSRSRDIPKKEIVDVEEEMSKLNDEMVAQDDPRLIKIIKDHYLYPPSTEPYNLNNPHRKDHSGQGKDSLVPSTVRNLPEKGFFIECGARDGEGLSSTLYFERQKNWTGLLIEANPTYFAQLRQKQRKAYLLNACLNTKPYPSVMRFNQQIGISRLVEGSLKEAYAHHSNFKIVENITEVQCFPLYSVLQALGGPRVDYMSLDVEGSELDILTTVPWDKVDMRVMLVEFSHQAGKLPPLKRFLEDKGYKTLKVVTEDILVQMEK